MSAQMAAASEFRSLKASGLREAGDEKMQAIRGWLKRRPGKRPAPHCQW
jgi:hypothetical protein